MDAGLGWCEGKLDAGGSVADVGCGHGASTILMAQAFPKSRFAGFDYHGPPIEKACEAATAAGVAYRTTFKIAPAKEYPGAEYNLVTFFDCLHDHGDPVGASRHVLFTLAEKGVDNCRAYGQPQDRGEPQPCRTRVFYSASTFICTPASKSQEVGLGLGAQAGEGRLAKVIGEGGFNHIVRVAETPFNMVLQAARVSESAGAPPSRQSYSR